MALNFPSAPSNGDTFENYVYDATDGVWKRSVPGIELNGISDVNITTPVDGQALVYNAGTSSWINGEGSTVPVTISETAPVSPEAGELWLNSTEAKMYVYYNDGTSSQWVAAVGGTVPEQGKIIAVKHALFTGIQSASVAAGDNVAVTDLSITHALANSANKLIISAFFGAAASSNGYGRTALALHDGSGLIAVGDSPGSRTAVTSGGVVSGSTLSYMVSTPSVTLVHSPGDTSSRTYTVRAVNVESGTSTIYINRTADDTDNAVRVRAVSGFVIQEVAV